MKQKLLLIMNPCSGVKKANHFLTDILALFCQAGYQCQAQMTTGRGDGTALAREYGRDADLVVCVGGDGTFNEVVSGMLDGGATAPIGYIPAGSTNDFASSLHLSKEPLQAAKDILMGIPRQYDVGRFGDRYFTYVASFGAFSQTSYTTPQSLKNTLGHLAYVLEGVRSLGSIKPLHLRFDTDNGVFEDDYLFGAISNSTSVGGILTLSPDVVDLNDGKFELLLIRKPANMMELNQCIVDLTSQQYDSPLITFTDASRAVITAQDGVDWSLDGEYYQGQESIAAENLHNAIRLVQNQI